jgi:hypothetical protein
MTTTMRWPLSMDEGRRGLPILAPRDDGPAPGAAPWLLLVALALAAGAFLRFWQLDAQVLIDDEWHAIQRLLVADVPHILTRLGYADYSIPLTVGFRLLYEHGMLSERWMHYPVAVAGMALLVVAPLLLRRRITLAVQAAWVMLLALSPLLVYHSKVARPYAFTVLLTYVAIVVFPRFARGGSRGAGVLYAACVWLAGYLHPIVLPFALMPLAYFGLAAAWRLLRQRGPDGGGPRSTGTAVATSRTVLLRCVVLGAALGVPLGVALLPPMINDWQQFGAKAGRDSVTLQSVYRSGLMLAGTRHALVALVLALLALGGAVRLARRDAPWLRYVGAVLAVGAVTVALSRATWIYHPLVYARYLLPALPFLLLFAAEGLVALVAPLARMAAPARRGVAFAGWAAQAPGAAAVALTGLALFLLGPIPALSYFPNQFYGHLRFQYDYDPAHNPYVTEVPKEPVPQFYRMLAQRPPGSVTLVEMPWRLESNFNPHAWYQQVHRQWVRIGLVTPVCGTRSFGEYPEDPGMRMRHFTHLSALLRGDTGGADYLVVHLDPWKTPPDAEVEWPDMRACLPRIEARFGAPVWRSDAMRVYALR